MRLFQVPGARHGRCPCHAKAILISLHPFGNLAIPPSRAGGWTHGFASPPCDGFAVSRMEVSGEKQRGEGAACSDRGGHAGKLLCRNCRVCFKPGQISISQTVMGPPEAVLSRATHGHAGFSRPADRETLPWRYGHVHFASSAGPDQEYNAPNSLRRHGFSMATLCPLHCSFSSLCVN